MSVNSIYPVIQTANIVASRNFYRDLLRLEVAWQSDWYVVFVAPETPGSQLALLAAGHESVPIRYYRQPAGVVISFEVSDASALYARATKLGLRIVQHLRDEQFGQRHFMVVDPDGLLVDVVEILFIPGPT